MPARAPACFLDHDGRVFLVEEHGVLRLPRRDEVPFPFREKRTIELRGTRVVFGNPEALHGHDEWPWKDDLPFLGNVEPLARTASNVSMARVVSKGVFARPGGEVLLVKPKVGFFTGRWSLPGGYLDYGESPEECVLREVEEELGVPGELGRLLHVESEVVASGIHFLSFLYEGTLRHERFALKADEIEAVRWFPLRDAAREVGSALGRKGIDQLLAERVA
ncbi:MAG: NUDIX hydrolase [Halobacteriales archaeon]|nr:NUDIX hydrolase [Halobacteriales archaeon]